MATSRDWGGWGGEMRIGPFCSLSCEAEETNGGR